MSEIVQLTKLPQREVDINITSRALHAFQEAAREENKSFVRIGIKGGGCSGFMYNLEFINEDEIDKEEDIRIEEDSVTFVVDVFSKEYLNGTTIDYVMSLQETGFKFDNPKVKKSCGCGSSFSV